MGSDGRACTGATFTHPEAESQQLVPALLPGVEAVSRREALRIFKDVYIRSQSVARPCRSLRRHSQPSWRGACLGLRRCLAWPYQGGPHRGRGSVATALGLVALEVFVFSGASAQPTTWDKEKKEVGAWQGGPGCSGAAQ